MPVDPGGRLKAQSAQLALVLVALPPRGLPLAQIVDVERDRPRDAADRQLDLASESRAAGPLTEPATERDLWMVFDVEEVGASQMLVPLGARRSRSRWRRSPPRTSHRRNGPSQAPTA